MATITYKTVIAQAIADFNAIQTVINNKKSNFTGARPDVTIASNVAPSLGEALTVTANLANDIASYLQWNATGTYTVNGPSSSYSVKFYEYVSVPGVSTNGTYITTTNTGYQVATSAGWIGTNNYIIAGAIGDATVTGTTNATASANVSTAMNKLPSKPATGDDGVDYWSINPGITVNGGTATVKVDVTKAGWIPTTTKSTNATVNVTGNSGTTLYIPRASFVADGSTIKVTTSGGGYIPNEAGTSVHVRAGTITPAPTNAKVSPTAAIASGTGLTAWSTTAPSNTGGGTTWYSITATGNTTLTNNGTVTYTTGFTSGWIGTAPGTTTVGVTIAASSNAIGYIPRAFFSTSAVSGVTYTTDIYETFSKSNANFTVPAGGTLYIRAGYLPDTKITLSQLIPDITTGKELTTASPFAISGYQYYTETGEVGVGTMSIITPNTTYYTTDSTAGYAPFGGTAAIPVALDNTYYVKSGAYDGTYLNTTSGRNAITRAGWINSTLYVKDGTLGNVEGGALSITKNTTAATTTGNLAVTTEATNYHVRVVASRAVTTQTFSSGWIGTGATPLSSDTITAYIRAASTSSAYVSPTVTNTVNSPSVGTVTTFNSSTGAILASGSRTAAITATANVAAATGTLASNYYYTQSISYGIATAIEKPATGTATLSTTATGSDVDMYVEALYKRMLGKTYSAVSADQ